MATPKQKKSAQPSETAEPIGRLADELGPIEKDLATPEGQVWVRKIARAELLRKAIRSSVPEGAAADQPLQKDGEKFSALLGPCGNQTVVDYAAIVQRIGAAEYATFATAPLNVLTRHVKPGIVAAAIYTKQTGPRPLTVIEKGGVA